MDMKQYYIQTRTVHGWHRIAPLPNYDSIKAPVIQFIEEVRPKKRIFQFVASFFLNQSITDENFLHHYIFH